MKTFFGLHTWVFSGLKGILGLLLGTLILINPAEAIKIIATYFGLFAILGGALVLFYGFREKSRGRKSTFWLIEGSFNIIIGLIIVSYPEISVSVFIALFGIWAIIIGILQFISYDRYRKLNIHAGIILVHAILSVLIGILLIFNPFEGAQIIAIIIGLYAIIYGAFNILASFKIAVN